MIDPIIPGLEPDPPGREWGRVAVIFGALVLLILIPLLRWRHHESRRPSLVEIRVVAATEQDPVFREGPRTVGPEERVSLAVALRLEYPDRGSRWLAPVERLELDGASVDHIQEESWPQSGRTARAFWFTLENPFLGGVLDAKDIQTKLAIRPLLAPELGQGFLAHGEPESHADDGINLGATLVPVRAGTYRVYARVEVVANDGSSRPLFAATSLGVDRFDDPAMVRISRDLAGTFPGVHPAVGRLFRLPGFEPSVSSSLDLTEACTGLIATSSRTFAAMAVTGHCDAADLGLDSLGRLSVTASGIASTLRWQTDVRSGDILKQGDHWMVAISDDGNGFLDGPDLIAHSWGRPPAILPLASALNDTPAEVGIFRITGP